MDGLKWVSGDAGGGGGADTTETSRKGREQRVPGEALREAGLLILRHPRSSSAPCSVAAGQNMTRT